MDDESITVTLRVDGKGFGLVRLPIAANIGRSALVVLAVCFVSSAAAMAYGIAAHAMWATCFGSFIAAVGSNVLAVAWHRAARRWAIVALFQEKRFRDQLRSISDGYAGRIAPN